MFEKQLTLYLFFIYVVTYASNCCINVFAGICLFWIKNAAHSAFLGDFFLKNALLVSLGYA